MKTLTTYLQPLRRRMGLRFVIDRDPDHRKAIFLAGTGRSGGTWVSEIINQHNERTHEHTNTKRIPVAVPKRPVG